MDADPLADTVPPRYALESDDEEDESNPLGAAPSYDTAVSFQGNFPRQGPLIISSGDAAIYWARGAELGEQTGAVMLNGVQVGLVFNPSWTKATVIASEVTTRIPVWAMTPYARSLLDELKPTTVSLLDSYPVPAYITNQPTTIDGAPIRFLATPKPHPSTLKSQIPSFAPPNLVNTTSASFLALLALDTAIQGSLFLLPSPHIPSPPPKLVSPSNISHLSGDPDAEWSSKLMNIAHDLLLQGVGEEGQSGKGWHNKGTGGSLASNRKRGGVGEGSMYI